jgi:O-antigen/teichoic acid export membrane protein
VLIGIAGVIAARSLGPEGRGIVGGVLIWGQTLPYIALMGMNSSLTVRVAGGLECAVASAIGSALAWSALAGAVFLVPALIFIPPTLEALGPDARELAGIALVLIPVGILTELLMAILLALHRIRHYNVCRLASPIILCASTVALHATGRITTTAVVILTVGSTLVSLVASCAGVPWRHMLLLPRELLQDFIFGLKAAIAGWANLVNLRFDVLLMSTFVSASQIGYYGIANNAMLPIATIATAAAGLLMPSVARLGTDAPAQITLIRHEVRRYAGISLLGALLLAAAAPFLIPALFGTAFEPAVVLVWILIPGYVARVWAGMITAGAVGMRRTRVGNTIAGSSLAVTVVLLPLLLPRHGALGAAMTSTAAYIVGGLAAALCLRRLDGPHLVEPVEVAPAVPMVGLGQVPTE